MNPRLRRGEWDSNPRVLANMGLAIPRPTRLGDPRFTIIFWHGYINYLQSKMSRAKKFAFNGITVLIFFIILG